MYYLAKNKGFVLLYAVLVASVISVSSIVLSSIIFKQLIVSSLGQNSQLAFYAANIGHNCASFYTGNDDLVDNNPFGYYDIDNQQYIQGIPNTIDCLADQGSITISYSDEDYDYGFYEFDIFNIQDQSCAYVRVIPEIEGPSLKYKIYSWGYNIEGVDGTCQGSHPRKVERLYQLP